ncbi:MAG: RyR domain-containing protein, partial [Acidobacteriota bacterium]|nr:RyR domain-containing protein [Acidobacteriota bacterium]
SFDEPPPEFEQVRRLLLVARVGKLWHRARAARLEAGERVSFAGHARETLDQMRAEGVVSDEQIVKAEDEVRDAEATAERARAAADAAETAARDASSEERIDELRSRDPRELVPPVVILAGGMDPAARHRISAYRQTLDTAFDGSRGTVIDEGEPLQMWCDLLACGVRPNDVRVLGIGGGKPASFEYHLALMLGATVGLVPASGGAAAELAADAAWWPPGQLLVLPDDVMTLRAFVNPPRTDLTDEQVDGAARVVHEIHTKEKSRKQADAALRSWEHTPRDFQESNRQQVIYAEQILRRVGYRVGALKADTEDPEFTPEQVETMAELEHGRWVVERLAMGWSWGEEKDEKKRISPYLVAWDQVPDDIRDYDREAVRTYPRTLRKAGLGVFPEEP